jgi:DnaK suppressor protein
MAKNKKSPAKAAKKAAKAKTAAKAKKVAPAKAKKSAAKKTVSKKAAPKKAVAKKPVVAKKAVSKKEAPKKVKKAPAVKDTSKKTVAKNTPTPVKKAAPAKAAPPKAPEVQKPVAKPVSKPTAAKKPVKTTEETATVSVQQPATPKPVPPQLNIFPVPNQRPIAHKPAKAASSTDERSRYSEDELKEFEALILRKLDKAREEYKILKDTLNRNNDEGTDATSGGNTKVLEDGAETAEKENLSQLAARQQKYITNLENALVRIKNGTYGICSVTGKLIPKERLIAVPHTTQSIEAKMMQQD